MISHLAVLVIGFLVALGFVLISIIRFNMHPFLSLLIGGILMGLIVGMPLPTIASSISSGFGNTMGSVGIVIALGIILGELLFRSGAAEQIASLMLNIVGEKHAVLAINLTGYIVSIPVFFDAAFVILINLVKSMSRKGKIPFASLVVALSVGLITTHAMVIPTPGPLAVASNMNINIGLMLLYAIPVALVGSLVGGVFYANWLGKRKDYVNDFAKAFEDIEEIPVKSNKNYPSGWLGLFLVFLPIFIILLGNTVTLFVPKEAIAYAFFAFLGDKNIALLISVIVAFVCLRSYLKSSFNELITECIQQAGPILAITGAGGAFGAVITSSGIGSALASSMEGLAQGASAGVVMVIVAFIISQLLRAAQGSTTVALVTTSAMFAPIVSSMANVSPVLIALAICAGGIGCSLPNDSGFWVVNRFSKFSLAQTLQTWTIGGTISGVSSLAVLVILALFQNSLPGLL